ncbi:TTAGGG repeat binding factor, partial [Linderina pennispora]
TRRAHRQAISESDSSSEDLAVQRRRHQKQGYRYWTAEEEACFIQAVGEFGYKWTRILRHHGKDGIADQILRNRTTVNLKDKARDIKQKLQREGKPLGPFARASRRH